MNAIVPVVPRPAALAALCAAVFTVSGPVVFTAAGPAAAQGLGQPMAAPVSAPATAQAAAPPPVALLPPPPRGTTGAPAGTGEMPEVLSDGAEFCANLGARIGDMSRDTKMPAEAADLAREGKRLCADGKTRSGIMHLRRAYVMLRQMESPAGGTKP